MAAGITNYKTQQLVVTADTILTEQQTAAIIRLNGEVTVSLPSPVEGINYKIVCYSNTGGAQVVSSATGAIDFVGVTIAYNGKPIEDYEPGVTAITITDHALRGTRMECYASTGRWFIDGYGYHDSATASVFSVV